MNYRNILPSSPMPFGGIGGSILALLVVWSLVWKGLALWRAARKNDSTWFVILLVLNTVGILEIIYYFIIAKNDKPKAST